MMIQGETSSQQQPLKNSPKVGKRFNLFGFDSPKLAA